MINFTKVVQMFQIAHTVYNNSCKISHNMSCVCITFFSDAYFPQIYLLSSCLVILSFSKVLVLVDEFSAKLINNCITHILNTKCIVEW